MSEQWNHQGKFMTVKEVLAFLGIAEITLYRHVAAGKIPAPMKIGRSNVWSERDVKAIKRGMEASK